MEDIQNIIKLNFTRSERHFDIIAINLFPSVVLVGKSRKSSISLGQTHQSER